GDFRLHARRPRTDAHGISRSCTVLRTRPLSIRRGKRAWRSVAARTALVVRVLRARQRTGARAVGGVVVTTRLRIAVRTLAQLTCRTGDIHFRFDESTDGQEGIDAQKR